MTPSHFSSALEPASQRFSVNSILPRLPPGGYSQVSSFSKLSDQCCFHLLLLATDFQLLRGKKKQKNALSLHFLTGINTFLRWSN